MVPLRSFTPVHVVVDVDGNTDLLSYEGDRIGRNDLAALGKLSIALKEFQEEGKAQARGTTLIHQRTPFVVRERPELSKFVRMAVWDHGRITASQLFLDSLGALAWVSLALGEVIFILHTRNCRPCYACALIRHTRSTRMSVDDNKALVRHWWETYNTHAIDFEAFIHPDMVNTAAPPPLRHGIDNFKMIITSTLTAVPDQHWEIEDLLAEGDRVACYMTWSGTHQASVGLFAGIVPTGKRFSVQHIHTFRITDGKLSGHGAVRDDLGMFRQLGVIAPFGAA